MSPDTHLIISIATLTLTPLLSALVIRYQLSEGHGYWRSQQNYLREKERFGLRVNLLKRSTSVMNKCHDLVTHHHIYASSRDTAIALASAIDPQTSAYYKEEYERFRSKAAESYLESRLLSSQISEIAVEASVYFNIGIRQHIIEYREKFKAAMAPPLSAEKVKEIVTEELAATANPNDARDKVAQIYDSKTGAEELAKEAGHILEQITREVLDEG